MRKNLFGSFSFASVLIATALVSFDAQVAMACSGGSSSSGLSHGSSVGSGSVTVCVGSSGGSSGSSFTQTVTKTVKVPVKKKAAKAPKKLASVAPKPVARPAPIQAPVSCPSPAQLASMPRSADAAERWVGSVCSPPAKTTTISKPAPKPAPQHKRQFETRTITETITIDTPGSSYSNQDAAKFYPNPLRAIMAPERVLSIGQVASFSSNPASHFGMSSVLGRQAQVHFVPAATGWTFSDGSEQLGADTSHSFQSAGTHNVQAWVIYEISYRLLGETSWESVAGQLTVLSNPLEVLVGALNLKGDEASQGTFLVGEDCLAKPKSLGCRI